LFNLFDFEIFIISTVFYNNFIFIWNRGLSILLNYYLRYFLVITITVVC